MPYGTDAFVDGYGDYKQPTVVDYDKRVEDSTVNKLRPSTPEEKKEILKQFQIDQENILKEILEINPLFAGELYQYLVIAVNNKLAWNIEKINSLKGDVDWLYNLRRYLNKRKQSLITT